MAHLAHPSLDNIHPHSRAMNLGDITVLIPAAGRVPEGLIALSNIACPAMIPVAGRPVIHWTMSYLRSLGMRRFVIAVARRGMFVEDFVDSAFGDCDVRFIVPSRDGGVGLTIRELAEAAATPAALVVLGDTHFEFGKTTPWQQPDLPLVLTSSVKESYRWCVVEQDHAGMLGKLHDKVAGLPEPLEALIGVYYFPDLQLLRETARIASEAVESSGRRVELAGILERVQAHVPVRVARAGSWLDCGNPDMQARAHQALLQARAFNELQIDPMLGTICKRSSNPEKFIDEINYLRLLPADLAILFPRVLGFSTAWSDPWVVMEYYGYPNLADVFLFENLDPAVWERIFAHLHAILREGFAKHSRPLSRGAVTDMYVRKTRLRLETMKCSPELRNLVEYSGSVVINGREVQNLRGLWPRIEADVRALDTTARGTIIHGDLCLSNILYDLRSRICKLIDPRGSFGSVGLYGDPRYDVAKLWHSVHGLYDFIVNDLFRVSLNGNHAELTIRSTVAHKDIEERFKQVFFDHERIATRREIDLVTALLFASMPALHADKPARQLAMYLRSLQLLDDYIRGDHS